MFLFLRSHVNCILFFLKKKTQFDVFLGLEDIICFNNIFVSNFVMGLSSRGECATVILRRHLAVVLFVICLHNDGNFTMLNLPPTDRSFVCKQ